MNYEQILNNLIAGNKRFATMQSQHPNQSLAHREALLAGQHPPAIILGCTDSRVPPELIFDQGLGDLFVVRSAGNVLNEHVIAAIEFAVFAMGSRLIVVLGHSLCGAVAATVSEIELPGYLPTLTSAIRPALDHAQQQPGDLLENTIRTNIQMIAADLVTRSTLLAEHIQKDEIKVVTAYYDLATSLVELL